MNVSEAQNERYLLEEEVAEILRCSRGKIKQLRLSGRLPYVPGRPVLIDREDLRLFIDNAKIAATSDPMTPYRKDPNAWKKGTEAARKAWLKSQRQRP